MAPLLSPPMLATIDQKFPPIVALCHMSNLYFWSLGDLFKVGILQSLRWL